ncbi:type 1 fimbrial protein [Salmonella enterica subsp. salamae]|nr:type 1 fimbrial protein [Salmonella enterica subsp. salamae]SQH40963.1 S-fimbrial adhesin protein SfaS [Salmonella enterica]
MHISHGKKAAALILAFGGLFSSASQAVNIDITGLVVASPCVVNGNNQSLAVNLGDAIQANELSASGSATAWTDVTLKLTNCPASTTSFSVAFAGTTDTDADYYKNTGTATNLKLELTDETGSAVYKNGAKLENVAIPGTTHAYDLKMRARAMSNGSVMPGTIVGQVQATFTYQ